MTLPSVVDMPFPPRPDNLIAQARDGDPDALTRVYTEHARALIALAFRLTGSRADAEDVLHDVFLGLPEALAHYEERGSFGSWLKRVTVRVALTRMRSQTRFREVELEESITAPTRHDTTDLERVQRAIRALSPALRAVFVLREIEDYSHAEIAAMLGISARASAVRLHRAIRILRETLGELR